MNRKHIFCVILYTLFSFSSFSQNFKAVDSIALSYKSNYGSPKKLANQIKQDFKTDLDRVRAIYTWMANNISYDIQESSFPSYSYSDEEDRIQKEQEYAVRLSKRVITKKKAVCEGYSMLFRSLCDQLNIPVSVVTGASKTRTRDIGRRYNSDHAWNIVTIDNQKYLIDVTWGAKSEQPQKEAIDYSYFMTPPELFILNHYPDEYSNSLLDTKISKRVFSEKPIFYNYYPSRVTLIQPSKGTFFKGNKYTFKLKTTESIKWVSIKMGKESRSIKEFNHENGLLSFDVGVPNYANAKDVIIYVNGTPLLAYKIKQKS